ncbi:MAG: site-2 protease family protein [Planctomycetaceae bacterium]|nr:site-2 protease family protein [Planctomycetaceae bacterium]
MARTTAPAGPADTRGEADALEPPRQKPRLAGRLIPLVLFVATCLSTFLAGLQPGWGMPLPPDWAEMTPREIWRDLFSDATAVRNGIRYSGALMLILLSHELGHWLQCRRYRVKATLPYFIPMPIIPFGTMGAGIMMNARDANRKKLFDIAISGPLAGLVFALPILWLGVQEANVVDTPALYGDPPLLQWMIAAVHGPVPAGMSISRSPLLFAGWVGVFVTALNLMPYGHLDGGHILYTLIGRKSAFIGIGLLLAAVGFMVHIGYPVYAMIVFLLLLMGPVHPPTADDRVPLGPVRIALGWLTLAFVLIGFTPMPIDIERLEQQQERQVQPEIPVPAPRSAVVIPEVPRLS